MLLAYALLALSVCAPLIHLAAASNPVPTRLESGLLADLAGRNGAGNQGETRDGSAGPNQSGGNHIGSADGYFDAVAAIPPSQLGWLLTPPLGGWQEWAAPVGGVNAAAGGGAALPTADPADLSRVGGALGVVPDEQYCLQASPSLRALHLPAFPGSCLPHSLPCF